ncbi:alpha/beta fold hydrolase [Stackebrandtia nassauensis]|uniref:AB hydrolase-1 domain-containing protein n=1 Tax=Stackebrandtia nassauensis (strain DSM 44728 / CIP 108903 / NRRL B-16338 / NBRC 102104 / LLR-40K-21) TaxID=446470 RepID=D3Q028_STANL|nr:alpha/beta hydrolase [Stackebrandtia nassauensis]ADD45557.1 hypothetical protein Snas_5930 [Stackebrandtia nassauensis DSM 44728]
MFTLNSPDGTEVLAAVDGRGPVILFLHAGMDSETAWARPARRLADRFRTLRVRRRRYRLDLTDEVARSLASEVDDVAALARAMDAPVLLVGHSSGAVVALEAMVAAPSSFAGAVLYEPPIVTGPPLGGEALVRARAAVAAGKPGAAIAGFVRDVVGMPGWIARAAGMYAAVSPRMRALVPRQVEELAAIDELGNRLDAYARIDSPVLLLGGERSPANLAHRLDALAAVLPHAERRTLRKLGHDGNRRSPGMLAGVIAEFADRVLNHD